MEKILMNESSQKSEKEIIELKNTISVLESRFVPIFETLNIGELTTDLLNDTFKNKGNEVKKMVLIQADKDVLKIRNQAIRDHLLNSVKSQIDDFAINCGKLSKKINLDVFPYLVVEDGKIKALPNAEQQIREGNYYYIETEQEKQLYDALCKISEGYNEFMGGLGANAKRLIISIRQVEQLLISDEKGLIFPDNFNDYKSLTQ